MEEISTECKVNDLNLFYQNCYTSRFVYDIYKEEDAEVLRDLLRDVRDNSRRGIAHFFRFGTDGKPVVMTEKEIDRHYKAASKGIMLPF